MKPFYFFIVLIIVIPVACRNRIVKTKVAEAIRVKTDSVIPETLSIPVNSSGVLMSAEEMKLSFKTGGVVAGISVREGERVKKGEILATLNLSEIDAQVNLARDGYEKALRDYTRAKNLFADSVATLEQEQNAMTALNMAKSNLDIALFNQSHSKIVAPDNGLILKQFVRSNELVSPGYPVFLFGTSGKSWKIKAGLSERDIVKINIGDSASVTFDSYPGVNFPGVVDQVGEISNPMTGTYETELLLTKAEYRLASGFVAGVKIFPLRKESYVTVPIGSIIEADGQIGYIYLVSDSMTALKIKVNILTIIGSKAAVTGIPAGKKQIVSEGTAYLKNGARIVVIN